MIAGLLLAVGCALGGSVGVLLKERGAVAAPAVLVRHPLRSAVNLFSSKWWTMGRLVALGCVSVARREAALPSGIRQPAGHLCASGDRASTPDSERGYRAALSRRVGVRQSPDGAGSNPSRRATSTLASDWRSAIARAGAAGPTSVPARRARPFDHRPTARSDRRRGLGLSAEGVSAPTLTGQRLAACPGKRPHRPPRPSPRRAVTAAGHDRPTPTGF
jgi:hypothetical protein